ncbi:MAG: GNAT family N-acetyltransferase [Candidatus Cohnella colombiensis]|uniref:GNAT family N-acetyltransferase n=1 Tax=Candidatus Cohnella colombiensis TaxID=3121368 RepID=A0AA95F1E0_9BACL|nr:MAG: GNAT family N-acetyltransferase [Cohnella sp.]
MTNTIIRKAQMSDLPDIVKLAKENNLDRISTASQQKGFLVSNFSMEQYEQCIQQNELFFVIEVAQVVRGFLLAYRKHELDSTSLIYRKIMKHAKDDFTLIKQICIERNSHQHGYGSRLYDYIMLNTEHDIYLAIVLEPINKASINFHFKLGFKQISTFIGEDQKKRGISYWNNPQSVPTYDPSIILQQYEVAMELYKHEDQLNWSKINHLLYVTGGLFAVVSFLSNVISPEDTFFLYFLSVISGVGILASYMFNIAISNGVIYLQRRKQSVVDIEKILVHMGGYKVVSVNYDQLEKHYKRSPTTNVMKMIPKGIGIIWCCVLLVTLMYY